MFQGDFGISGIPLTANLTMVLFFFTVVIVSTQDEDFIIPTIDVFHTIISWRTFNECTILTAIIWCSRNVERMIGTKMFCIFLVYNLITYLPFFVAFLLLFGFKKRMSFFYFFPYSSFIYAFWKIPETKIYNKISDKMILVVLMIFEITSFIPYSFIPLLASIIGNVLWSYDVFRLKKLIRKSFSCIGNNDAYHLIDDENIEANAPVLNDNVNNDLDFDQSLVEKITEMGFTHQQAVDALKNNDGDIEKAVSSLL